MKIKNITTKYIKYLLLLFVAAVLYSCTEEPTDTLWDKYKDAGNSANPEISYVDVVSKGWPAPGEAGSYWASIDTIAIHGKNFGLDTTSQWVYFNNTKANIVFFSDSLLYVKAPALVSDTVTVKVTKQKNEKWVSASIKLKEAIGTYWKYGNNDTVMAITFSKNGDLYGSLTGKNLSPKGVYKLYRNEAGDYVSEEYCKNGEETFYSGLKFKGEQLYACRNNAPYIYKLTQGVKPGSSARWAVTGKTTLTDFDFGPNGMLYAAGAANVFIIDENAVVTTVTSTIVAQSVRVFNNYVYVGGKKGTTEGVWRFPITGTNTLGAEELYFNVSSMVSTAKVKAITFDLNGGLYIGTDYKNPIIYYINGSGSFLFNGSLGPVARWFAWLPGSPYLLYSQDNKPVTGVIKVMTFNQSAPYYGIQ